MTSVTFKSSKEAAEYASKHTRCKIKTGTITLKQKDRSPKVERVWRVITYNRDKELK